MKLFESAVIDSEEPPRAFFVMSHNWVDPKNQIYTDDANKVGLFMLARWFPEYALWINDRAYDWPKTADVMAVAEHLKYLLDFDNVFYPPEEFPRGHWWE